MIGDNILLVQWEVVKDSKNRIVIPMETGREPNEELVLTYNKELGIYEVYSKRNIEERQEQLLYKASNAKTKIERIECEIELYEFCKSILRIQKINKQGRLQLGNSFKGKEKILVIGANDHLIIEPIKKEK